MLLGRTLLPNGLGGLNDIGVRKSILTLARFIGILKADVWLISHPLTEYVSQENEQRSCYE